GGLTGANSYHETYLPTISNCYSTGNVSRISGGDGRVGAFTGENYNGTIENSYSTGNVYFIASTDPTDRGFVGFNNGGINTNNFFDEDVSNQTTAFGATAKTTVEMNDIATFTDLPNAGLSAPVWDFKGTQNDDADTDDIW